MKKLFLVLALAILSIGATYAQQGKFGIGGQFNLASENNLVGLGGHLNYNITDPLRLQFSGDYYFEHDHLSMGDINFDIHYLFDINGVKIYPLGGLTVEFFDAHGNSETRVGGNIGGGIEFNVAPSLTLGAELKGQLVDDFSRFNSAFRITYHF